MARQIYLNFILYFTYLIPYDNNSTEVVLMNIRSYTSTHRGQVTK